MKELLYQKKEREERNGEFQKHVNRQVRSSEISYKTLGEQPPPQFEGSPFRMEFVVTMLFNIAVMLSSLLQQARQVMVARLFWITNELEDKHSNS
jgi:hypothetical protein